MDCANALKPNLPTASAENLALPRSADHRRQYLTRGVESSGFLYANNKRAYAHGRCRKMSKVWQASRRRAIDELETTLLDKHGDRFSIAPWNSIERVHRK
jgi:hypothetical protein